MFHAVGEACANDGALAFTDASAVHQVACVGGMWVDRANLGHLKLTVDATAKGGFDTSTIHWTQTLQSGIPNAVQSSSIQPNSRDTKSAVSLTSDAKVVLNRDETAHVVLNFTAVKQGGQEWRKHVDVTLPLGKETSVAKDDDGVEYTVRVDKIVS